MKAGDRVYNKRRFSLLGYGPQAEEILTVRAVARTRFTASDGARHYLDQWSVVTPEIEARWNRVAAQRAADRELARLGGFREGLTRAHVLALPGIVDRVLALRREYEAAVAAVVAEAEGAGKVDRP